MVGAHLFVAACQRFCFSQLPVLGDSDVQPGRDAAGGHTTSAVTLDRRYCFNASRVVRVPSPVQAILGFSESSPDAA